MPTQEECQEFGEYVKLMRQSVDWNTRQLGSALGVHARTVEHWENGNGLTRHDLSDLTDNIRLVITNEQIRIRKVAEINNYHINKYTLKGGKLVSG